MKIPGMMLAFYILLLAAMPCCVIDNCPREKTNKSANHEKNDGDCGNCSPFFNCEGCATATVVYEPLHFELTAIQVKPVYTFYQLPILSQAAFDVWQPPQLG